MKGKKLVLATALFGVLLVAAMYLGLQPGNLAALAVGAAISTWRNRRRRKREKAFWSTVWRLRQARSADRARMLAGLEPPKLRNKVQAILAQDGSDQASGDIEQFPFPLGLRRLATRLYWTMWVLAVAMLATAAFVPAPLWLRCLPLGVGACCVYGAWSATQRERFCDSVIEITPFRVSELFPDGRVRTVLLNRYLELHHEPEQRRLRLTQNPHDPGIVLDFRRMGFDRLVDLILQYGELRPDNPESLRSNEG